MTDKEESKEISGLNDIYRDICDLVGFECMEKFFDQYKGLQISFPTRLFSKDFVVEVVRKEFDGSNARELARRFGYSERWIRSIAAEECKKTRKR